MGPVTVIGNQCHSPQLPGPMQPVANLRRIVRIQGIDTVATFQTRSRFRTRLTAPEESISRRAPAAPVELGA